MTQDNDVREGRATPVDAAESTAPAVLGGRVAKATHAVLAEDGGLPRAAVDAVSEQTERLIQRVVSAYETQVARGEVGHGGSASASTEVPLHLQTLADDVEPRVPGTTGLLYGRIQSGKTAGMISFVAHAIDNGFRTIIVLTSDNVALVDQTADRFLAVHGLRVESSATADRWPEERRNMKRNLPRRGLVVVCSKNVSRLAKLRELLKAIGSPDYPTLILDDEADQASLDANLRKRKKSKTPSLVDPTRVSEEIQQLRKLVPHNVFLQVTATPFAMFLQNVDSPFRPSFSFLLEPGAGYTGGERFFSEEIFDIESDAQSTPPLYLIPDTEPAALRDEPENLPIGLLRSMVFFLVAASAREIMEPGSYAKGQNFLCHESHRVADHKAVADLVRNFLDRLDDELLDEDPVATSHLEWAYAELGQTVEGLPPLTSIREDIEDRLPNRQVIVVNAEGDTLRPRPRVPNFIVGGNIVGRGLTIPTLLVTYYGRNPQVSQMDTMLQHARMFGYREKLMPFTRVFLPPTLAARFQGIHVAERELREALRQNTDGHLPVQIIGNLRPTRHGVLDPGTVATVRSAQHMYPQEADLHMSPKRERDIQRILADAGAPAGWDSVNHRNWFGEVSVEKFVELIKIFKVSDWNAEALEKIVGPLCSTRGPRIEARGMNRKGRSPMFPTGAIGGVELSTARTQPVPTFFVLRQTTARSNYGHRRFYYPTIVFPKSMPTHIYNELDED